MLSLSGDGGIKTLSSSNYEDLCEADGDRLPSSNLNMKNGDSNRVGDDASERSC